MRAGRVATASWRGRRGVLGSRVEDSEADATVIGEKATYKARGREHGIEPSGVLFDRVAGLVRINARNKIRFRRLIVTKPRNQ